ncbi:hypothetical protein IVB36_38900 [Bradyrhizobium sp. 35]|uniref:hypothetical protein n=1 Tax=Bradyrhizobium sp. 35 TaxID=2782670 RepID=UPI001FF7E6E7|nr:hypothetical protein [Bradyrhizobium sp. 35]MCK1456695.1 hypothetical protein [Bradyrhizobium sp. 35]
MKRVLAAVLLLMASALAASAQDIEARLTHQSMELYFDCLQRAVTKLDDYMSDAGTIARGAMGACNEEANDVALLSAGRDGRLAKPLREFIDAKGLEFGTTYVLKHRAARRSVPPPASPKPKAKPKPKGESI